MRAERSQAPNLNLPLPTGARARVLSLRVAGAIVLSRCAGRMATGLAALKNASGVRWWNHTRAVRESTRETESTLSRFEASGDASAVSLTSWKVYRTSSAVPGTPSLQQARELS